MSSVIAIEAKPLAEKTETVSGPIARKPRVWTPFVALVLSVVAAGVFGIFAEFLIGVAQGIIKHAQHVDLATAKSMVNSVVGQPIPALLLALIPAQLGFLSIPLLAAWFSKEPFKQRLGLVPQSGRKLSVFKIASLSGLTLSTGLTAAFIAGMFLGDPGKNVLSNAMSVKSMWQLTLVSIVISVIPGLVEEILFRGYIQRRLLQRWSPAVAILVSAGLFAAMHMDSVQHIIAVVPVGLLLGLLAFRTNSTTPGMLVHALHNTGCVVIASLGQFVLVNLSEGMAAAALLGMLLVLSIVGLPTAISLLRRDKKVVENEPEPRSTLTNFGVDSRLMGQAA